MRATIWMCLAVVAALWHGSESAQDAWIQAPNCMERIPADLIKQLAEKTKQLSNTLTKDMDRHKRFLPKFCTGCSKLQNRISTWEVHMLLEFYSEKVFTREKDYPSLFLLLLSRLRHELQHCQMLSPTKPSEWSRTMMKKMERQFKKLMLGESQGKRERAVIKAVREFRQVLHWISELRERRAGNRTERR